ncbi:heme-binding protein [Microbacterium tumbae]
MEEAFIREELARVRAERGIRQVDRFSHSDAIAVGQEALRIADAHGLPVVVDVRRGDQIVFHAALAGTTAEHDDWVRRKVNTAVRHEVPSYELLLRQRDSGRAPDWLDPREFAVAGGSVPVEVAGSVVGAVTVSGIVGSPSGDHDLAMSALRAVGERADG